MVGRGRIVTQGMLELELDAFRSKPSSVYQSETKRLKACYMYIVTVPALITMQMRGYRNHMYFPFVI